MFGTTRKQNAVIVAFLGILYMIYVDNYHTPTIRGRKCGRADEPKNIPSLKGEVQAESPEKNDEEMENESEDIPIVESFESDPTISTEMEIMDDTEKYSGILIAEHTGMPSHIARYATKIPKEIHYRNRSSRIESVPSFSAYRSTTSQTSRFAHLS